MQGQDEVVHWFVAVSQHWSARQSACVWQHVLQEPLWQHSPEPAQSESAQHVAVVHDPLQHFCPAAHWALDVHVQLLVPHCWVVVSQHWLARQPALVRQPATHWPPLHTGVAPPQSALVQQLAVVHVLPQHFLPLPH